ncbi:24046_t:CDS:2 [Gigaspora margarita]|uniref:24046_t:CDS:1 n=1 Tax=Gigaspora margarita TaxID=4874 RepID=A0ABN7V8U9_GIGMA|nr:24046_t:CDS:2 [Gigaspora margarita]
MSQIVEQDFKNPSQLSNHDIVRHLVFLRLNHVLFYFGTNFYKIKINEEEIYINIARQELDKRENFDTITNNLRYRLDILDKIYSSAEMIFGPPGEPLRDNLTVQTNNQDNEDPNEQNVQIIERNNQDAKNPMNNDFNPVHHYQIIKLTRGPLTFETAKEKITNY